MLPNVGFTYDFMPRMSVFANYAKGLSVPSTDNLYNAFFFAPNTAAAPPNPEKTDNFDVGLRYRSPKVQAQLGGFFNRYTDRTASAFDPELNASTFRNLGKVDKYGIDGYVSYQPIKELNVYVFGSVLKSEIKDNLLIGECTAAQVAAGFPGCTAAGERHLRPDGGQARIRSREIHVRRHRPRHAGPLEIGITGKRTGPRYIYDTNEPVLAGNVITPAGITIVFPANTPGLLAGQSRRPPQPRRLRPREVLPPVQRLQPVRQILRRRLRRQSQPDDHATPRRDHPLGAPRFVQIGAPRTISATLVVGF